MSTPAREGAVPPEKGKRLSSLVTRMKTVLKRSDGSKRLSFSSKPAAATPSAAGPSTTKPSETPAPQPPQPELPIPSDPTKPTKVSLADLDAERARKLGERFKVNIEPIKRSSTVEKEAYRIEKPIRMRIHRSCHRCHTTFGSSKICVGCEHTRCTKCPRFPPKTSTDGKKGKEKEGGEGVIEVDGYWGLKDVIELRKPNPRTGGQPLVRKKPMQRVRRTCHECQTMFVGGAKICSNCNHIRCVDCPRDPAKKKKYPDGYPGDAPSSNTSLPVKYSCHQCSKVFPPIPHPDSGTPQPVQNCVRCGHERCRDCPRAPFVRVEPEPDEELVRRVEEKLRGLNVSLGGDVAAT